jgi:hypothetical protein
MWQEMVRVVQERASLLVLAAFQVVCSRAFLWIPNEQSFPPALGCPVPFKNTEPNVFNCWKSVPLRPSHSKS